MLTEKERILLLKVIHDLEKIIPDFKETNEYLRQRRKCPGKRAYDRAIKKMDKLFMSYIRRVNENI